MYYIDDKLVETVSTQTIEAIISRVEIIKLINSKQLDTKNLVLISISEPVLEHYNDEALPDNEVKDFKDSLRVKFWDIEEDFGDYKIITDEQAKIIQDFIIKNKDNRFIINCKAGKSRSAAVGRSIECIVNFGIGEEAKYLYKTSFNSEIHNYSRYSPNLTVFDKIVKDYNEHI